MNTYKTFVFILIVLVTLVTMFFCNIPHKYINQQTSYPQTTCAQDQTSDQSFYGRAVYDKNNLIQSAPSINQHEPFCAHTHEYYSTKEVQSLRPIRLTHNTQNLDEPIYNFYQTLVCIEEQVLNHLIQKDWAAACSCGKELPATSFIIEIEKPPFTHTTFTVPLDTLEQSNLIVKNYQKGRCANESIYTGCVLAQNPALIANYSSNPNQAYYKDTVLRSHFDDLNNFREITALLLKTYLQNLIHLIKQEKPDSEINYTSIDEFLKDTQQTYLTELLETLLEPYDPENRTLLKNNTESLSDMINNFIKNHGASDQTILDRHAYANKFTLLFMSYVVQRPIVIWILTQAPTVSFKGIFSPHYAIRKNHDSLGIDAWIHLLVDYRGAPHIECLRITEYMQKIEAISNSIHSPINHITVDPIPLETLE